MAIFIICFLLSHQRRTKISTFFKNPSSVRDWLTFWSNRPFTWSIAINSNNIEQVTKISKSHFNVVFEFVFSTDKWIFLFIFQIASFCLDTLGRIDWVPNYVPSGDDLFYSWALSDLTCNIQIQEYLFHTRHTEYSQSSSIIL